ncbi:hypothetical protein [Thermococcus sp. JdF3]|uniref:LolA family protein n=1 Tax=Thermococcus sp. JdF3 TaxID=1638258 RepID=UPI0014394F09|nr:hypothetical protein [Thermococcus sp. JdF3]NJE02001.1 hypothetical protein [Thermococcus sp. JdF3]
MRKAWLSVILMVLASGCISTYHSTEDVLSYWHSIDSFTAHEVVKIGNQTFESYVTFIKPDKIARADYINGSPVQKVVIENNTQKVITANGTFFLNATLDDVNALDPFVAILNNLDSFNVKRQGDILLLKPKTEGMPTYEVELNGKLPEIITIKQAGLTIVVEYKTIEVVK